MTNLLRSIITEEQHAKNLKLANFRFMWTAQIIFLNYRKCIDEKWFEYYYNLYLERVIKSDNKSLENNVSFDDYKNDSYVDNIISRYCKLFWKADLNYSEMDFLEKVEEVYKELIDDSEKIWNDKIVNKSNNSQLLG